MQPSEKTSLYRQSDRTSPGRDCAVTIFDANCPPYTINLADFKKPVVTFGRAAGNDIVFASHLVSHTHGQFEYINGQWIIRDQGSTNGLIYNEMGIAQHIISNGDFIRIDDGVEAISEGVLLVFSAGKEPNRWERFPVGQNQKITIGRSSNCSISFPNISTSNIHAVILREGDRYYLEDCQSTNGTILNGEHVSGKKVLHEKDVITITDSKIIFTSSDIYYCRTKTGISVDVSDVVIRRGKREKSFVTSNHVSLGVRPGELVAIIGGSGAGKSTILNCMCGYLPPAQGSVYINGINLYQNFDSLKKIIGYVPQSDIVYDNLTLWDMLIYAAKLRLPSDINTTERNAAIQRAIETVELTDKQNSLIKSLSGGQRKRASIAVELLSDPNLLFLDEPASGLDPGTERNLMHSLRQMADSGKTVILVTHSVLQLALCDKVVFMGKGGNLCFYGSQKEALDFFGVADTVDIYNLITDHAEQWRDKYNNTVPPVSPAQYVGLSHTRNKKQRMKQLCILTQRCAKLTMNDRQRTLLLVCQAPVLAFLISLVATGKQFEQYEMTKSLLFALSCSAFWVGMLNAIQEVCKERTILKREYMTGLSLSSYVGSKIGVLSVLCIIQSFLLTSMFTLLVGFPEEGVLLHPYLELLITTILTAISSAAMGLFVSSLFSNADRAMTIAPILLMPQILFSGLIFKLEGATQAISWFAVCRWSMEGYGTTADLNELPLKLQEEGIAIPHEAESFYEFTADNLITAWCVLVAFTVAFLLLARIVLSKLRKENA